MLLFRLCFLPGWVVLCRNRPSLPSRCAQAAGAEAKQSEGVRGPLGRKMGRMLRAMLAVGARCMCSCPMGALYCRAFGRVARVSHPRAAAEGVWHKLEGVKSGEIKLSLLRAALPSPQLRDILLILERQPTCWTRRLLDKYKVR